MLPWMHGRGDRAPARPAPARTRAPCCVCVNVLVEAATCLL